MRSLIAAILAACMAVPASTQEWIRIGPLGARSSLPAFAGFLPDVDLWALDGYLKVLNNGDPDGEPVRINLPLPVPNGTAIDSIGFCYVTAPGTNLQVGPFQSSPDFGTNVPWSDSEWHSTGGGVDCLSSDIPEPSAVGGTLTLWFAYDSDLPEFVVNDIRVRLVAEATGADEIPLSTDPLLDRNYPNPFNPSTRIGFQLPEDTRIELNVYGAGGALVRRLLDRRLAGGRHEIVWDGLDETGRPVSSGVYFYELRQDGRREARKMILVK